MHSENCQTSNIELSVENTQRLSFASYFRKKLPLICFRESQVRKIGDITNGKGKSKLT